MAIRFGNYFYYLSFHLLLLMAFFNDASAQETFNICAGESVVLNATPGADVYDWTPTHFLSNPEVFNPKAKPLVTTTYIARGFDITTENLVINGNFSEDTVGMTTEYELLNAAESIPGMIKVDENGSNLNSIFPNCLQPSGDHGPMLLVDGALSPDLRIWCQLIEVLPNTDYLLSAFATSLFNANHPQLQFYINDTHIGDNLYLSKAATCEWQHFVGYWNSGTATQAEICIINPNTIAWGNDLAIDSIEFFGLQFLSSDTLTVEVLPTYEIDIDTAICAETTLQYNGQSFTPGTFQSFTFSTQAGCDSVVNLSVELTDQLFKEIRIDTLCTGDTLQLFGEMITSDTVICRTTALSPTCDSTICAEVVFLSGTALTPEIQAASCAEFSDGSILVTPIAGLPPYSYSWSDGSVSAFRQNLSGGAYFVTVTDKNGCTASRVFNLPEPLPLESNLEILPTQCFGEANGKVLLGTSGGTAPYVYARDGLGFAPRNTFSNLSSGAYTIQIKDANGCIISELVEIEESPEFQLFLPSDARLSLGESINVNLYTNLNENLTYSWIPEEGLSCSDCPNPVITPSDNTIYQIEVSSDRGCIATGIWQVLVDKNYQIYVPNAFSPNDDGRNDTFTFFSSRNIASIQFFQIFNRWGAQVYSATDCLPGDSNCTWDGDFNNQPLQDGIYLYSIQVQFIDGRIESFNGDVLLIR